MSRTPEDKSRAVMLACATQRGNPTWKPKVFDAVVRLGQSRYDLLVATDNYSFALRVRGSDASFLDEPWGLLTADPEPAANLPTYWHACRYLDSDPARHVGIDARLIARVADVQDALRVECRAALRALSDKAAKRGDKTARDIFYDRSVKSEPRAEWRLRGELDPVAWCVRAEAEDRSHVPTLYVGAIMPWRIQR